MILSTILLNFPQAKDIHQRVFKQELMVSLSLIVRLHMLMELPMFGAQQILLLFMNTLSKRYNLMEPGMNTNTKVILRKIISTISMKIIMLMVHMRFKSTCMILVTGNVTLNLKMELTGQELKNGVMEKVATILTKKIIIVLPLNIVIVQVIAVMLCLKDSLNELQLLKDYHWADNYFI